ncbi:hypothetical protein ABPG74_021144 [Tetrahymena malaccensis]
MKVEQTIQKASQTKNFSLSFWLKQFYTNELIKLVRPINLNKNISTFIVLINSITVLSFALKSDNQDYQQQELIIQQRRLNEISNFIKYLQVKPFLNDYFPPINSNDDALAIISLILNSSFVFIISFIYAFRQFKLSKYFEIYLFFYTTVYNKWPFYVFLNISFNIISENTQIYSIYLVVISYLNTILTLAIEAILLMFNDHYLSKDINKIYSYLSAASLQISLCILIQIFIFQNSDITFGCIVTVPLSILLIVNYKKQQKESLFFQYSNQSDILQCSISKFLKIIRTLYDQAILSQENYVQGGQGINFEIIIQIHEQNCKYGSNKSCFCNKYRRFDDDQQAIQIDEFQAQQFRQEYANKVILQLFEIYINSHQKNNQNNTLNQLKLSYLNYIYDIINDPVRVLVNLQKMSIDYLNDPSTSLTQLFYFQSLKLQILNDYQIKLFDSKIENQNINMMEVILFDEKINVCKEQLKLILLKIGHFYDFLSGNYISLQQLEVMAQPLINLNKNLEQIIIDLFQINPEDLDLQYLTSIYIQLLDFQNRRVKEFQIAALQLSQCKANKLKKIIQINQETQKTCVLFTSLIEKEFIVNKTTNQFKKLFGYSSEFIQGKNLNILIPNLLKNYHNQMIQSFIDEQSMDIINQGFLAIYFYQFKMAILFNNKGERNVFGLDSNGFVFPMSLRIKLQVFENDIGACSLIQKQKQGFSYIFFEKQGNVTDFSKKIFLDIFQSLGFKLSTSFNIFDLIPSLQEIVQNQMQNKENNSFLVIKEPSYLTINKKQTSLEDHVQSPKNINSFYSQNNEIFHIKFKYLKQSTKNQVDINYIQINSYLRETSPVKKTQIVDELNKQKMMKEFQSLKNIESQQSFDFFNSLQQQHFSTRDLSQQFENQDQINLKNKEDCIVNCQQQLNLEKSKMDQLNNLKEIYKFHQKQIQDQRLQKYQENQFPNNYLKYQDLKQLSSSGICEKQNQEFQFQTINSPARITTNIIEYPEMILSPTIFSQERQQILVYQPNENQLDSMFQLNQQNQLDCKNFQDTSLNKHYSYQQLNQFFNKNNSNLIQNNSLSKISYKNNQEKSLSVDLPLEPKNKSFKENEELQHELKNEIASVNSSKYSTEEIMKKKMIQKIKKTEFTKGLHLMAISGVLAFIILSIVSLIIYFQNLNSLSSFIDSFLKIDDALYCFIDTMNIIGLNNYYSVLGINETFIIDNIDLQNYEYNQTDYQQQAVLQDYNSNLQKLVLNNDSGDQLNYLLNDMFQVQIYAAGFYNNARVQKNSTTTFQQSLQYTINVFFYEITFYYINYEEQQEDFIWGNIYNFKLQMKNLQLIVENYAKDQFNNINLYQIFAIILFATISAILVFSILPLYAVIQIQKEKILKLFGTFSPSSVEFQIKQIELGLYKIEQINLLRQQVENSSQAHKKNSNQKKQIQKLIDINFNLNQNDELQKNQKMLCLQFPTYIHRQLDKRNRQIASFSSIKKFNLLLFFWGMVAVVLLLVMPILNFIVFIPFETESKVTLQDRIYLIDVFSLIIENFSPHMEQVYLISTNFPTFASYYQTYLQDLQSQNEQSIQNLLDLTSDFTVQRNDQGLFVDFYQNLFNSNVCQVRQDYPQYFNSNITESNCNNIFNGILQRGLIFSVQKVFQTFQEMYQIYTIQDINEVTNQFIYFQTQYSFIQFKQLIQVISEAVNGIRQYQNDQLQSYENSLKQNLFYFFIIQMIIFCIVFLIGWVYLFYWFKEQLLNTTKIFTLFHINLLYENQFIQQYFRQIQIRN